MRTTVMNVDQIIDYVMPIYYTKLPLLPHCKEKLIEGWKKISANKAEGFYKMKAEYPDQVPCPTPMVFFANRLVLRLCEVHPVCNSMFKKSSLKQGTLILNMFTALIKEIDNPEAFNKYLKMLALSHIKIGVKATEFGIFGEALFWALRAVLGPDDYDLITHTAWLKFYSRILDGVVPIVLAHEMAQSHMTKEFNAVISMPIMASVEMAKKGLVDEDTVKSL
eukprot:CAMPEP_0173154946 /NCGR_PEP_ID=MMETSP1105-20130129/13790_1 /TAXON_ID=2985 /ORGANISM="Ochromonas sp., Strain BG-1" /LENGTH=221 /DNA_ID=CAMNT_0014071233 /DNA_START=125 /DNA_END=790 /DNA_ORIENTATION=-